MVAQQIRTDTWIEADVAGGDDDDDVAAAVADAADADAVEAVEVASS